MIEPDNIFVMQTSVYFDFWFQLFLLPWLLDIFFRDNFGGLQLLWARIQVCKLVHLGEPTFAQEASF